MVRAGDGFLTAGTAAVARGALVGGRGLTGEGLGQHFFRQDVAQLDEDGFDVGELGSPGRAVRAIELIRKVFADAFEIGA